MSYVRRSKACQVSRCSSHEGPLFWVVDDVRDSTSCSSCPDTTCVSSSVRSPTLTPEIRGSWSRAGILPVFRKGTRDQRTPGRSVSPSPLLRPACPCADGLQGRPCEEYVGRIAQVGPRVLKRGHSRHDDSASRPATRWMPSLSYAVRFMLLVSDELSWNTRVTAGTFATSVA